MNYRTVILSALSLSLSSMYAALVDDIVTQETTYATQLSEFNELLKLQGDEQKDEIGDLPTDLNTLKTAIASLITTHSGLDAIAEVDTDYRTRVVTVQDDTNDLIDRVTDLTAIADTQEAHMDGLTDIIGLKIEPSSSQTIAQLETANAALVTSASNTINAQITAAQAIVDAGVGAVGGLKTASSQTQFNIERARLILADQLTDLLPTLSALNTTLLNAVAASPNPEDDSIAFFDGDLLTHQTTIESAAAALKTAANTAIAKAQEIIATDQDENDDDLTDRIPTIAEVVTETLQSFTKKAEKQEANSALTRTEIALRTLQRQYLFDQLESNLAAIQSKYSTQLIDNAALAAAFAELKKLDNSPVIAFPSTPLAATTEGKSGVEQLIDMQTANEVSSTQTKVQVLNDNQPTDPVLLGNGTTRMKPVLRFLAISKMMFAFIDARKANSAPKRLAAAVGDPAKESVLTELTTEWAQYLSLATDYVNAITESSLDSLKANALTQLSAANTTDLFLGVSGNSRILRAFTIRANRARRSSIRRLRGVAKNAELVVLNDLAAELATNGEIAPAATPSTTPDSATNTEGETDASQARFTGNVIDGDVRTRTDIADGDQILISGESASFDDPIIAAAADKLTANIKIFLKESAKIGLGAANFSTKSGGQSPNTLGGTGDEANSIQLVVDGNAYVRLHSDIYITGSKPFIATKRFGQGNGHRLTFYAEKDVAIRVKKNTTLDLSAFANTRSGTERGDALTDTASYAAFGKQLVFAGKTRLVLEPGAKIRFPKVPNGEKEKGVVLYFNDESRLIFESDLTNEDRTFEATTLTGTDCIRNKLMGMGQVWLNKTAVMEVQEGAFVGVESDYHTSLTDITLSLQRNSELQIGSPSIKGGAFQVGNIFNGGSKKNPHSTDADASFPNTSNNTDGGFVPRPTSVNFTLTLNGPQARCTIGRNGFFGMGAGILNKKSLLNNWELHRLFNVGSCTLDISQGIFEHNQVAAGDDASGNASLLAIGPARHYPNGKYLLKLGKPTESFIRGGGNMMFMSRDKSLSIDGSGDLVSSTLTPTISSTRTPLTVDNLGTSNTGRYTILAPSAIIRNRHARLIAQGQSGATTAHRMYGRGFVVPTKGTSYLLACPQEEFFQALSMPDIDDISTVPSVVIGYGGQGVKYAYGYMKGTTIKRRDLSALRQSDITPTSYRPSDAITTKSGPGYLSTTLDGGFPKYFEQADQG